MRKLRSTAALALSVLLLQGCSSSADAPDRTKSDQTAPSAEAARLPGETVESTAPVQEIPEAAKEEKEVEEIKAEKEAKDEKGGKGEKIEFTETVIYDQNGLKVTALGLDDSFASKDLKLLVENNSDTSYTVQVRNVSVNGRMIDPLFSCDVAPGKKANDELAFMNSRLNEQGIKEISTIDFNLHIFRSDDFITAFDSDPISLVFGEAADSTAPTDGEVLVDQNGLKITSTGLTSGSFLGSGIGLYIENNGDQPQTVQVRDCSVNGFMVDPLFSCDVMPGKTVVDSIIIPDRNLEDNGIDKIETVELSFHVFNSDDWSDTFETAPVTIKY